MQKTYREMKVRCYGKPFIKLLRTENNFYFFDVNRNEIVSINQDLHEYLLDLE